jgi:hypothetical protein
MAGPRASRPRAGARPCRGVPGWTLAAGRCRVRRVPAQGRHRTSLDRTAGTALPYRARGGRATARLRKPSVCPSAGRGVGTSGARPEREPARSRSARSHPSWQRERPRLRLTPFTGRFIGRVLRDTGRSRRLEHVDAAADVWVGVRRPGRRRSLARSSSSPVATSRVAPTCVADGRLRGGRGMRGLRWRPARACRAPRRERLPWPERRGRVRRRRAR